MRLLEQAGRNASRLMEELRRRRGELNLSDVDMKMGQWEQGGRLLEQAIEAARKTLWDVKGAMGDADASAT